MKRKRKDSAPSNDWINTYADMVTLLLCFFILLFSMSTVDADRWKALLRTFQNEGEGTQIVVVPGEDGDELAGNVEDETDFALLRREIETSIGESEFLEDVEIGGNDKIIFIRLNNNLLFDGNSAVLRQNTISFLESLGNFLKLYEEALAQVRINGHTAYVPRELTNVSDRVLSTQRANAVLMYLEDVKLFDPKKLVAIGFGRNFPIAPNDTEATMARNRRVEILILAHNFEASTDINILKLLTGQFDAELYEQLLGGRQEE